MTGDPDPTIAELAAKLSAFRATCDETVAPPEPADLRPVREAFNEAFAAANTQLATLQTGYRFFIGAVPTETAYPGFLTGALLRERLGSATYSSWFQPFRIESVDGATVRASVPQRFLRNWIVAHYMSDLVDCCGDEFPQCTQVDVEVRNDDASRPLPCEPPYLLVIPLRLANNHGPEYLSADIIVDRDRVMHVVVQDALSDDCSLFEAMPLPDGCESWAPVLARLFALILPAAVC